MRSDNPVTNKDQDLLYRYQFAEELVKGLLTNFENGQENIVIGLNGEWGSGKSSLLEFIKSEIETQTENEPFRNFIFEFNPWRILDQDMLQEQFLKELGSMLGNYSISYEGLKKDVKKFADVTATGNKANTDPTSKIAISTIASLIKNFSKDISVTDLKKEVDDRLEDDNIKQFIFIDDIDRLRPLEIAEIFQLIKLNANFKNTYFIVAFDKNIVINSLADLYGLQGEKYLEKIIQIDYTIPLIPDETIYNIFKEELKTVYSKSELKLSTEFFQNIWTKYLRKYFTTIRHVYRFINSLEIRLPIISQDINPFDFILIEIIRIFDFNAYEWITKNKDRLTFNRISKFSLLIGNIGNDKKSVNEDINKLLDNNNEIKNIYPKTLEIILDLFSLSEYDSYQTIEERINKSKKIVSNDYFNQYFSFVISSYNIPDSDLQKYVSEKEIERFIILKHYSDNGLLKKFLQRLSYKIEFLENKPDSELLIQQLVDFSDSELQSLYFENVNQIGWGIIFNGIIEIAKIYQGGFKIFMSCLTEEKSSYTRFNILNNLVYEIYKKNNIHLSLIPSDILESSNEIVHEKHKFQSIEIAKKILDHEIELEYFELRNFFYVLKSASNEYYDKLLQEYTNSIEKTILLFKYSLSNYKVTGQIGVGLSLIENCWIIPDMTISKFDKILSKADLSNFCGEDLKFLTLFHNLKKEGFKRDVYYSIEGEKIEMI